MKKNSTVAFIIYGLFFCGSVNASIISETFDTDTTGLSATLSQYPDFNYIGTQDVSISGGNVFMSSAVGTISNFVVTPFSGMLSNDITISADIGSSPGGGSYNVGMVIGDNRLVFHPGFGTGAFRVEGLGGFSNVDMGFTPPAGIANLHHMNITLSHLTGLFEIEIIDTTNPANIFSTSFINNALSSDLQIGFTVAGGGGSGVFDNLSISTASPVPAPAAVWLLGSGLIGLIGMKKKSSKLSGKYA